MAQPTVTSRRLILAGGIALAAALAAALLSPALDPLEGRISSLRYAAAASPQPDSGIVVVYLDNEAVSSLGWPVPRSFYALMVRALSDLGASAIGIEVLFEQHGTGFPEYDSLLASVAGTARTVVASAYFGNLAEEGTAGTVPAASRYPGVTRVSGLGGELHLPFPLLAAAAGGIGHLNLSDANAVPLFISSGTDILPSFGLEILRMAAGSDRSAVRIDGGRVIIEGSGRAFEVPVDGDGRAAVRLPSNPSAIPSYRFLDVLRAYDRLRLGSEPELPVESFRGKIVLIGVIGEGRSTFLSTPVVERFPSLLFQAAFVDNAVRGSFLTSVPPWLCWAGCWLAAFLCAGALFVFRSPWSFLTAWTVPVVAAGTSLILFSTGGIVLPLTPFLAAAALAAIASMLVRQRMVRDQVGVLESEKASIAAELRDREAKLAVLERELVHSRDPDAETRMGELVEEIRRYKAEIRSLTSKADDMEVYPAAEDRAAAGEEVFEKIVYSGGSAMAPVVEFVGKIALSDAPVLILGESGTGKELVARAIHRRSKRQDRPFIAVNCGALAETLLESELFGHEKGAFTGAVKEKAGRFEMADGGTVFLDEIGEVSENFQVKLLRVLQEGELERVGGTQTIRVSVRILAATNRDLKDAVRARKFREDLYYRLNVLSVHLPPLRDRKEDLPLLLHRFLEREDGALSVSKNVMEAFRGYDWPGNVRELESAVKRAALLARAERRMMITMKDLPAELASAAQGTARLEDQVLESVREKGFSRSAITETAAELGGLNRGTVAEYLRGQCLKALVDHGFDVDETVRYLSLSADREVHERVGRRLQEYLENIADGIDTSQPWDSARIALKPKMKNLPQRYHRFLEQVAEAYFRGRFNAP